MTKKLETSLVICKPGKLDLTPSLEQQERLRDILAWEKRSNKKYFVLGEPSQYVPRANDYQ